MDTPDKLAECAAMLCQAREIAIDLEQHSYRSFQGFVCLMQASGAQGW